MKRESWVRTEYGIGAGFGMFIVLAHLLGWTAGPDMARNFYDFSLKMIMLVLFIFVLIGILDDWVPKDAIQKHIGEDSGVKGIFYVVLLAFFQGGPLYVAFPVAHLLWKKGASVRNVFCLHRSFFGPQGSHGHVRDQLPGLQVLPDQGGRIPARVSPDSGDHVEECPPQGTSHEQTVRQSALTGNALPQARQCPGRPEAPGKRRPDYRSRRACNKCI